MIKSIDLRFELTPRACYISSPPGVKTSAIEKVLASRGLITILGSEVAKSADINGRNILKSVVNSDYMIAVLRTGADNTNVYYEIGLAHGLGKRTLIIASPEIKQSVTKLKSSLYLRLEINNEDSVAFAIDQVLGAPEIEMDSPAMVVRENKPIGKLADDLLSELRNPDNTWGAHPENAVVKALGTSGVNALVKSKYWDDGADIAVWADELENIIGNPLLVEVKQRISGTTSITRLSNQLESYLDNSNAEYLLLLYLEGPESESEAWEQIPDSVFHMPVPDFLTTFENNNLIQIISSLKYDVKQAAITES